MLFYKKKKIIVDGNEQIVDSDTVLAQPSSEGALDTKARFMLIKSGIAEKPVVKDLPIMQDGYVYLFAVYDKLSQRYTYPIPQISVEVANRYFLTLLSHEDPSTRESYQLFILGEYDPVRGTFAIYKEPTFVKEGNKENA